MKKIMNIGLLLLTLCLCSCCIQTKTNDSSETNNSLLILQPTETSNTGTVFCVPAYDVNPLNLDYSFDDIFDKLVELSGVDINEFVDLSDEYGWHSNAECSFTYVWDYSSFLEYATRRSPEGLTLYHPSETEYHINRRILFDGFGVNEYENSFWAEEDYRNSVNLIFNEADVIDGSDYENGYCFIYDDSVELNEKFYACYYYGNYRIDYTYSYNRGDIDNYRTYLTICNDLGLPTCDQITESILG